jgi:glucose/arabinose dehydrogenase
MHSVDQAQKPKRWWYASSGLLVGLAILAQIWLAAQPSAAIRAQDSVLGSAAIELELEEFSSFFVAPVDITHAGDSRLFVVERRGVISIVQGDGNKLETPFLDIIDRVDSNHGEQGLLGLAFEPGNPSVFYVNYTRKHEEPAKEGDTVIARYRLSNSDPNRADPDSEQIVLVVSQPYDNHNAGDLAFGPDNYLYLTMGDGGGGGDPDDNGQDLSQLLAKVLRIDVIGQITYTAPANNPFVADGLPNTRAEIWSWGWRNPWRLSFDRATGDLWVGDVGQGDWEEIDHEAANTPGLNYGWDTCEGSYVYPEQNGTPVKCPTNDSLVEPVFEYSHDKGCSVTGGFVYRGTRYPNLVGRYLLADYCSARFWSLFPDGQGGWAATEHGSLGISLPTTFGEGADGELYVTDYRAGKIYHIKEVSVTTATATPTSTSTNEPTLTPTHTLAPVTPPALTPQAYLPLVRKDR